VADRCAAQQRDGWSGTLEDGALPRSTGIASALVAGALFGASTPLAKRLLRDVDSWMLAGLLYLGSGIGLAAYRLLRGFMRQNSANGAPLGADRWWLAGAILSGGIVAPVLMMYGLRLTAGSSASLLLNLEGVFSVLIAWVAFKESFDARVAAGVLLIFAGALLLSIDGKLIWDNALGPAAVAGACLAWALDNNLTRKVALKDVTQISMLKGLIAGAVNIAIAAALGAAVPPAQAALAAGAVGLAGYGLSLVLFVIALRHLGTARTGAYFSIAPFVGALIAVAFFGESLTIKIMCAGVLMIGGIWLHLSEQHDHEHGHGGLTHDHEHIHDAHHQHSHDSNYSPAGPHSHVHTHEPMRHAHPHYPDEHHRHVH
jgi:drug/metabolite transporter (DMT)-like permease